MRTMTMLAMATMLTACFRTESDFTILDGVEVAPGEMAGDMPEVPEFEEELTVNDAEMWGTWMDVDLHVEDDDVGWAMVSGSVDLWDYVDVREPIAYGTEIVLDEEDTWNWVGCAGPESGWADFDEEPQGVRLTFEDPADLGLVPEGTDVDGEAVGVIVDADFGYGDMVRSVTLMQVR